MRVELWFDVRCPWTFMSSRWLVQDVALQRDVDLVWNPMSLFLVHEPDSDSPSHEKLWFTHRLLRVITAVRESEGAYSAGRAYLEMAQRAWMQRDWTFDPATALTAVGVDAGFAAAFEEDRWDEPIRESMARAYALIGEGVGNTPIIAIADEAGALHGMYGPELVKQPAADRSVALWDALVEVVTGDTLATLGRETPELPNFGSEG